MAEGMTNDNEWVRRLFEASADPAWIIVEDRFVDCNDAAVQALGYPSREVLLNTHPWVLSPPFQPDGESSDDKAARLIAETRVRGFHCFEWMHRRFDGSDFLVEVTLSQANHQGEPLIVCIWRDLSARRAKDEKIRELLAEQQLIFDNANAGILISRQRRVVRCNRRFAEMLGYDSPDELLGQCSRIFYRSDEEFEQCGVQGYGQLQARGQAYFECLLRRKDGSDLWVVQSGSTLEHGERDVFEMPTIWVYTDVSLQKLAELALRRSEEKFSKAFDFCPLAASISTLDDGLFLEVNQGYERHFGWTRAELLGRSSVAVGLWPDGKAREAWLQAVRAGQRLDDYEASWVHKSGERRVVHLSSEIFELEGRAVILNYVTDVTALKLAEQDLRIAAAAFDSQESMIVTDARGIILRVNRAFTETTGYSAEDVIGKTPAVLRSGRHDAVFYQDMWRTIAEQGSWQGEIWDRRKNGEIYPKWLTISAVADASGVVTHYVGSHFDITERKLAEERINTLAFYDQLTGLPNRTLLFDRLNRALARAQRQTNHGALLFIDLDNFKTLNDTQGHDIGDRLLKEVSQRIKTCIREEDTAARIGGDEFVVVLSGLGGEPDIAARKAGVIARKILAALDRDHWIGQLTHRSSGSIGVTLFQEHSVSAEELMRQGDMAMYRAKAAGRNSICFFDPEMEAAVRIKAALEQDLRQAIAQGGFVLHYQAQVGCTGEITGAEVLVRWPHPRDGMISPARFIPLAEEIRQIAPLGLWVLRSACRTLAEWRNDPRLGRLTIAVNVSAGQFLEADFVEQVLGVLAESGADPRQLKLELTESLFASDIELIIDRMQRLKRCGIGFSLDDFGTGYSSLSYLKRLPIDQLKIDQSFVRDVLTDANDAAIARTVIALGQTLGCAVIAEGVETLAQRDFLAEHGCHAYQGYYFAKPEPVDAFVGRVQSG